MYEIIGPKNHITLSRADLWLLLAVIVWELAWKGMALWRAGRNKQLVWFVVMLVINTVGILEIAYLLFFQSKTIDKQTDKTTKQ